MRHLPFVLMCAAILLAAGCVPVQLQSPPPPAQAQPPVPPANTGPYWHQTAATVSPADAMAYYAALKTLTLGEVEQEHQRLLKSIDSTDNRLAKVQYVLLSFLPGQTMADNNEAIKSLEAARQDAELHRELGDLLILLNDQLSARVSVKSQEQGQGQECSQALRTARKKAKAQSEELTTCREERDDLANKLQKLQDIERGLLYRERKQ